MLSTFDGGKNVTDKCLKSISLQAHASHWQLRRVIDARRFKRRRAAPNDARHQHCHSSHSAQPASTNTPTESGSLYVCFVATRTHFGRVEIATGDLSRFLGLTGLATRHGKNRGHTWRLRTRGTFVRRRSRSEALNAVVESKQWHFLRQRAAPCCEEMGLQLDTDISCMFLGTDGDRCTECRKVR